VQGRPIIAHRIGSGGIKIVLVGNIHGGPEANTRVLVQQLWQHYQEHRNDVPAHVSLWIVPTMNPDGLATDHRWNANGVDLNRNADTDLDGCAGNDWAQDTVGHEGPHPGAGGAHPFSEPEARAIRDFLGDAWIVVFYHSAAEAIFVDTCSRHAPTHRLADVLSEATGYPVPEEGWTGYPITGDFGDYLAGEGVAAATLELTDHEDPEFDRNLAGVQAVLTRVDEIVNAEGLAVNAKVLWLDESNTSAWRFAENAFPHPIGLEIVDQTAYVLDAGRVLGFDLQEPGPPSVILAPGDYVEDVRVLEPLDLAAHRDALLALDRAGDIYRYDLLRRAWTVERYDRPPRDTTDHYFVALAAGAGAGYLLETTHEQVWRLALPTPRSAPQGTAWIGLPRSRDVDLAVLGGDLYVLTRALNAPMGNLLRYRSGESDPAFEVNVDLMHPRQTVTGVSETYILDRAGRRLLVVDAQNGVVTRLYQFLDRRAVSAVGMDPSTRQLVLAGPDSLYFIGDDDRASFVEEESHSTAKGSLVLVGPQPHNPALLEGLRGLTMPIEGARITSRDFQMPGAPRHYRLGVHEGIDFYGTTSGIAISRGTPVRAVDDGEVVRVSADYEPLTASKADALAAQTRALGYTPPEVLDGYRGLQVWIDHGDGLISRYAHLSSIEPGIVQGSLVSQGQVIGAVGNSGTPASIRSLTAEAHLHLELWIHDHFVGQFLRPVEAREWLQKILR
jgi:murein DD-endopeptidase MepM/ murein hydrolase activator NlpD